MAIRQDEYNNEVKNAWGKEQGARGREVVSDQ
jgi:hypothetical protein